MKRNISNVFFSIIVLLSILNFTSCSNREETVSCFPSTPINVVLNLNLPSYFALQNVGSWVYVDEQQSGTRGLIIVKTANGFKVYDRNPPHICPDQNTTLSVKDNIKITCPKDGAEWILYTGEPQKIAPIPPKTYPHSFDPYNNILSVYY
jgi:nitrite reductase/ring-hydroxylating ferredoxin subunit